MRKLILIIAALFISTATSQTIQFNNGAWNGGLVQENLNFAGPGNGDYPFINALLEGQDWSYGDNSGQVNISKMNAYGFPSDNTDLGHGGRQTIFSLPSASERPGNYIVDWQGTVTISPGGTVVSVSGTGCTKTTMTLRGANCSGTVTYSGSSANLKITATSNGGLAQLRVYNVNDAATLAAGQIFSTAFLSALSDFGAIRFLNKGNFPDSNVAVWTDRTPTTWWSYGAPYYPASMVTTNQITLSSGAGYNLAFPGISLTDKTHVISKAASTISPLSATTSASSSAGSSVLTFSSVPSGVVPGMLAADTTPGSDPINHTARVASTTSTTVTLSCASPCSAPIFRTVTSGDTIYFSPMINVNSTGYLPLAQESGTALTSSLSKNWLTLTYDAALNVWMVANAAFSNRGLQGGWPPEIMVALANRVRQHPWFPSPPYALDPPTNYISSLASYVKINLNANLIPRFEGVNEDWNYVQFGTSYSDNEEFLRTGANFDHANWYGRAISQLCQTVSSTCGADRTKYQCIAGFSTFDDSGIPARNGGGQANRLDSPEYVNAGGSAAYNWVTHLAIAGYYGSNDYGTNTEIGWAYGCSVNTNACKADLTSYLSDTTVNGSYCCSIPKANSRYSSFATYAASYTGIGMTQYEGGYSPDYSGASPQSVSSVTLGNPTVLTVGANPWNYICNTANLCTGGQPTTSLSFAGGCGLNGLDPAVTAATSTTITVNVNSTGLTGCTTGTAAYDGVGRWLPAFRKLSKLHPALQSYEYTNLDNFHKAGGVFPSKFEFSGAGVAWSMYDPDIYIMKPPRILAVQQYQRTP